MIKWATKNDPRTRGMRKKIEDLEAKLATTVTRKDLDVTRNALAVADVIRAAKDNPVAGCRR
jgi:hypothetical protein